MIEFEYPGGNRGTARAFEFHNNVFPASYLFRMEGETDSAWADRLNAVGVSILLTEGSSADPNTYDIGEPVSKLRDGITVVSYPNPIPKVPVWHTSTREQMYILPDSPLPPGYTNLEPEDGEYSRWTGEAWEYDIERKGISIRAERDKAIEDIMWRIQRHESETRLGLDPTDDISSLDNYIQQLRDMTKQAGFPTDVEWPVEPA